MKTILICILSVGIMGASLKLMAHAGLFTSKDTVKSVIQSFNPQIK